VPQPGSSVKEDRKNGRGFASIFLMWTWNPHLGRELEMKDGDTQPTRDRESLPDP